MGHCLAVWLAGVSGFIVIVSCRADEAAPAPPHYVLASWHTTDGLPSDRVHSVIQSRDGFLWIATQNGLARFDGNRFQIFNTRFDPSLQNDFINQLYEDHAGAIWIGNETGELTVLADGKFESIPVLDGWPGQPIERIVESCDGTMWLLSRAGVLCCVRDRKPVALVRSENEGRIQNIVVEPDGALWVATGSAVCRLRGRTVEWDETCPPRGLFRPRIVAAQRGGIWVAEAGRLRRWHDGQWVESRDVSIGQSIRTMAETRDGLVLVGTFDQGLQIVPPTGAIIHIDRNQGLPENWIQTICEDAEGNFWLGVGTHGLWRLHAGRVVLVNPPDHWFDCAVSCVTPRSQGGVWVGTEGAGLYRVNEGESERFLLKGRNTVVRSLFEDRNGVLWAGLSGVNLLTFDGQSFAKTFLDSELLHVFALTQTRDGTLWIGTTNGFAVSRNGGTTTSSYAFQNLRTNVRGIVETPDGTVWLGTLGRGVLRIQNGVRRFLDRADGLPGNYIWAMAADSEGTVWVGTYGHGLARIKDGQCTSVSVRNGLPSDVICHIEDDRAGNLWISSNRGIFRVAKSEIDQVVDGKKTLLSCLLLDTNDGLVSLEMSGGIQPSGCRTQDGRLWFGTAAGLAVVDPNRIHTSSRLAPVVIENLRVAGQPYDVQGGSGPPTLSTRAQRWVTLEPGAGHFEIDYTALSFTAPDRIRFRYRLEGWDDTWVDAGNRRTAYYSYLPPGKYVFRVIAANSDGLWNESGASLGFYLRPYFWQTAWFFVTSIGLGVLGIFGAALGVARYRHRRRLAEWQRREAISTERTRIARDIHDDLGAGLTQVLLLAHSAERLLPDTTRVAARICEIQSSVREMTQAMDEIVWAVNPRCDSLDSLVVYLGKFAQDFLQAGGVRCLLELPLELPACEISAASRHCLYLVTRETLNNILKHAGATIVRIGIEVDTDSITLVITDNGVGLGGTAAEGETSFSRTGSGLGLAGMRQRLNEAGGNLQIEDAPNGGTIVRLKIHLAPHPVRLRDE